MEIKAKKYVIGVDGGGSKTTAVLATLEGKIIKRAEVGSSQIRNIGLKKVVDNLVLVLEKVSPKNKEVLSVFMGLPAMEEEFKSNKAKIKKGLLR